MAGSSVPKSLKIFSNGGHDLQHDEDEDAAGEGDHGDRVDQGALDLAAEGFGPLLELGQTLEDDFQGTAGLAGLDHVDVEAVEGLGGLGHGLGERGPAFDLVADVDQGVFQGPGRDLLFENLQAAQDRQAGVLQDGELAGEGGQRPLLHAAEGETSCRGWPAFFCAADLAALLDGDLRDEVAHLPDRGLGLVLAGRFDDVLDLLAGGVHRLELIGRHG